MHFLPESKHIFFTVTATDMFKKLIAAYCEENK